MQEQASDLLSLTKTMHAFIYNNVKHFILWDEVRVQLVVFYQGMQEMVGSKTKL